MISQARNAIRTVGEAARILAPTVATTQPPAEDRRADLVAAQAAVQAAEDALNLAHDEQAQPAKIVEAEAALADTRLAADRAQRAYASAERRLAVALELEQREARAAATKRRDDALAVRDKAAHKMDALAAELAEQLQAFDAVRDTLTECQVAHVAAPGQIRTGRALVAFALERANVIESSWLGDRTQQPGAVELCERDAGAIISIIEEGN